MPKWLDRLRGRTAPTSQTASDQPAPPTPEEMAEAAAVLESSRRAATFGKIAGSRPAPPDQLTSQWSGPVFGLPGEIAPVCNETGNPMHPVFQVRFDELPAETPRPDNTALLTVWIDTTTTEHVYGTIGRGLAVRSYPSVDDLVPLEVEAPLPQFQVTWPHTIRQQPTWNDMAMKVPRAAATARDKDWFWETETLKTTYELQANHPIKIGGWPTWIQGGECREGDAFVLQVDSNPKGQLMIGDQGSLYLFRRDRAWHSEVDFY